MPDPDDDLAPFLHAVHRQLRGPHGAGSAASPDELRDLLHSAASKDTTPGALNDPVLLSAFFANLDLLPEPPTRLAMVVVRLVLAASARG